MLAKLVGEESPKTCLKGPPLSRKGRKTKRKITEKSAAVSRSGGDENKRKEQTPADRPKKRSALPWNQERPGTSTATEAELLQVQFSGGQSQRSSGAFDKETDSDRLKKGRARFPHAIAFACTL